MPSLSPEQAYGLGTATMSVFGPDTVGGGWAPDAGSSGQTTLSATPPPSSSYSAPSSSEAASPEPVSYYPLAGGLIGGGANTPSTNALAPTAGGAGPAPVKTGAPAASIPQFQGVGGRTQPAMRQPSVPRTSAPPTPVQQMGQANRDYSTMQQYMKNQQEMLADLPPLSQRVGSQPSSGGGFGFGAAGFGRGMTGRAGGTTQQIANRTAAQRYNRIQDSKTPSLDSLPQLSGPSAGGLAGPQTRGDWKAQQAQNKKDDDLKSYGLDPATATQKENLPPGFRGPATGSRITAEQERQARATRSRPHYGPGSGMTAAQQKQAQELGKQAELGIPPDANLPPGFKVTKEGLPSDLPGSDLMTEAQRMARGGKIASGQATPSAGDVLNKIVPPMPDELRTGPGQPASAVPAVPSAPPPPAAAAPSSGEAKPVSVTGGSELPAASAPAASASSSPVAITPAGKTFTDAQGNTYQGQTLTGGDSTTPAHQVASVFDTLAIPGDKPTTPSAPAATTPSTPAAPTPETPAPSTPAAPEAKPPSYGADIEEVDPDATPLEPESEPANKVPFAGEKTAADLAAEKEAGWEAQAQAAGVPGPAAIRGAREPEESLADLRNQYGPGEDLSDLLQEPADKVPFAEGESDKGFFGKLADGMTGSDMLDPEAQKGFFAGLGGQMAEGGAVSGWRSDEYGPGDLFDVGPRDPNYDAPEATYRGAGQPEFARSSEWERADPASGVEQVGSIGNLKIGWNAEKAREATGKLVGAAGWAGEKIGQVIGSQIPGMGMQGSQVFGQLGRSIGEETANIPARLLAPSALGRGNIGGGTAGERAKSSLATLVGYPSRVLEGMGGMAGEFAGNRELGEKIGKWAFLPSAIQRHFAGEPDPRYSGDTARIEGAVDLASLLDPAMFAGSQARRAASAAGKLDDAVRAARALDDIPTVTAANQLDQTAAARGSRRGGMPGEDIPPPRDGSPPPAATLLTEKEPPLAVPVIRQEARWTPAEAARDPGPFTASELSPVVPGGRPVPDMSMPQRFVPGEAHQVVPSQTAPRVGVPALLREASMTEAQAMTKPAWAAEIARIREAELMAARNAPSNLGSYQPSVYGFADNAAPPPRQPYGPSFGTGTQSPISLAGQYTPQAGQIPTPTRLLDDLPPVTAAELAQQDAYLRTLGQQQAPAPGTTTGKLPTGQLTGQAPSSLVIPGGANMTPAQRIAYFNQTMGRAPSEAEIARMGANVDWAARYADAVQATDAAETAFRAAPAGPAKDVLRGQYSQAIDFQHGAQNELRRSQGLSPLPPSAYDDALNRSYNAATGRYELLRPMQPPTTNGAPAGISGMPAGLSAGPTLSSLELFDQLQASRPGATSPRAPTMSSAGRITDSGSAATPSPSAGSAATPPLSLLEQMQATRKLAEQADLKWRMETQSWLNRPTWFTGMTDAVWNPTTMTLANAGQVLQGAAGLASNRPGWLNALSTGFSANAALGMPEGIRRLVGRGNVGTSYADFMYNPSKNFRDAFVKNLIGGANVGFSIEGLRRFYQNFFGGEQGRSNLAEENRQSAIGNADHRNWVRRLFGLPQVGKPQYPTQTPAQRAAEQAKIDEMNAYNAARGYPPISGGTKPKTTLDPANYWRTR